MKCHVTACKKLETRTSRFFISVITLLWTPHPYNWRPRCSSDSFTLGDTGDSIRWDITSSVEAIWFVWTANPIFIFAALILSPLTSFDSDAGRPVECRFNVAVTQNDYKSETIRRRRYDSAIFFNEALIFFRWLANSPRMDDQLYSSRGAPPLSSHVFHQWSPPFDSAMCVGSRGHSVSLKSLYGPLK